MDPRRLAPLAALLAASCTIPGGGPGPEEAAPVAAEVQSVLDGDSLRAVVAGVEVEVRLAGINAPERDECFGEEARAAAAALLGAAPLRLEPLPERDQFGRLLAYAEAGGVPVNEHLVAQGYALALQTDHPRRSEFLDADRRAYEAGAGMWAPDACGPAAGIRVALVRVEADPAGPDEADLNGEWVLLASRASVAADLSGWVLRDESSDHRYRFPGGTTLPPGGELRVHTGCGAAAPGERFWCAAGPVWNNTGDTALLLDPRGNVVSRLRYP